MGAKIIQPWAQGASEIPSPEPFNFFRAGGGLGRQAMERLRNAPQRSVVRRGRWNSQGQLKLSFT